MRVFAFTAGLLVCLLSPSVSQALSIAGFGNSITCDSCNDGSFLPLLDNYLITTPTIIDEGVSANTTAQVLGRLDLWLDTNTVDIIILLAGTPDTFFAVGGFMNKAYDEDDAVDNVEAMLDLILSTSMSVLLAAPPPVKSPCGPGLMPLPTCETIDGRLDSLSAALDSLASSKAVPFVDLYDIFKNDPGFLEPVGDPTSLFLGDGLHPQFATGDDLIAASIASALMTHNLIPEPSTGLLLAAGLCGLAVRRKRLVQL